jgi:hypothetical protein
MYDAMATSLLVIASNAGYDGKYRVAYCTWGRYPTGLAVGVVMRVGQTLPHTMILKHQHVDKDYKVEFVASSIEDFHTLLNEQENPSKVFPCLSRHLLRT